MKSQKHFKKRISVSKLLCLIIALAAFTGCAKTVTLYPIRDTDIRVTDDEVIMSKWYFDNVLRAKLEEGR